MYVEELRSAVSLLMANLESLPVSKGNTDSKYSLQKLKRFEAYLEFSFLSDYSHRVINCQ